MKLIVVIVALAFVPSAAAFHPLNARDRDNAAALLNSTIAAYPLTAKQVDPKAWVRCKLVAIPKHGTGITCTRYSKGAGLARYHHDRFDWEYTGRGLVLTYARDGELVFSADVSGISREGFMIERIFSI